LKGTLLAEAPLGKLGTPSWGNPTWNDEGIRVWWRGGRSSGTYQIDLDTKKLIDLKDIKGNDP